MEGDNKPERRTGKRTRDDVGNVLRTGKASTFYLKYETKDDLDFISEVTNEPKGKIIDRLVEQEANKLEE